MDGLLELLIAIFAMVFVMYAISRKATSIMLLGLALAAVAVLMFLEVV